LLTGVVTRPRFLWFLVAVSPGIFSTIAAGLLLIPMTLQPLSGNGPAEAAIFVLDGLGWLSAIVGLVLVRYRFAFLRQKPERQRAYAVAMWAMHVLAFVAFFGTVLILNRGP
jgi:hypothetical protein